MDRVPTLQPKPRRPVSQIRRPVYRASLRRKILLDYGMDYETIAAALCTMLWRYGQFPEDITERFGPVVAQLVDGVTKLDKINIVSRQERQAESMRKMLMAMVKDVRVIIIKLADRRTTYAPSMP
ncbi:MAG: HD domain-containing protein [Christensenellales bacterium]